MFVYHHINTTTGDAQRGHLPTLCRLVTTPPP